MDRMDFLKSVCGLGACGCALNILGTRYSLRAADPPAEDQRLRFARYQLAKMLGFMAVDAPPETCIGILEKTGRECAKLGQLQAKFKGDMEGYFAAAKKNWGTDFAWDKLKGVITITVPEGDCGCPVVDRRRTPAVFCHCSVGYQKETFDTLFGKPVKACLKESKLGGSQRCVFEITLT